MCVLQKQSQHFKKKKSNYAKFCQFLHRLIYCKLMLIGPDTTCLYIFLRRLRTGAPSMLKGFLQHTQ